MLVMYLCHQIITDISFHNAALNFGRSFFKEIINESAIIFHCNIYVMCDFSI